MARGVDPTAVLLQLGNSVTHVGIVGAGRPTRSFRTPELEAARATFAAEGDSLRCRQRWRQLVAELLIRIFHLELPAAGAVHAGKLSVYLLENHFCPTPFRDALADVLFRVFRVAAVSFIPDLVPVPYACGVSSGIVVDVGWAETRVLPVLFGVPLYLHFACIPVGCKAAVAALRRGLMEELLLEERATVAAELQLLPEPALDDLRVKLCYVRFEAEDIPAPAAESAAAASPAAGAPSEADSLKGRETPASPSAASPKAGGPRRISRLGPRRRASVTQPLRPAGGSGGGGGAAGGGGGAGSGSAAGSSAAAGSPAGSAAAGVSAAAAVSHSLAPFYRGDRFVFELPDDGAFNITMSTTGDAERVRVPAPLRHASCEPLFGARCADAAVAASVVDLFLDCVAALPLDARLPLLQNVALAGGGADIPGFRQRFAAEALARLKAGGVAGVPAQVGEKWAARLAFGAPAHDAGLPAALRAWYGASALAAAWEAARGAGAEPFQVRGEAGLLLPDWLTPPDLAITESPETQRLMMQAVVEDEDDAEAGPLEPAAAGPREPAEAGPLKAAQPVAAVAT